jgi:dTDP-4-amino-4,6-dideoxygalactose transaminase
MSAHNKDKFEFSHIIGGVFGLEIEIGRDSASAAARPPILTGPHLRLATARSAFTLLAKTLRPAKIWLPSYLCGVVLDAFAASGSRANFYAVGADLNISEDAWLEEVETGDMVVFIDYFGFNAWDRFGQQAEERGAWVVEDACQAMLNFHFSEYADYVIASPRKFIGVPDGGILMAQDGASLPPEKLLPPPQEWWLDALKASQLRAEFDRHGGDRQWFELFRKTDHHGPTEPRSMSELSSLLLDHAMDYQGIAEFRRRNFRWLAAALPDFALFHELSVDAVPLGFPVRLCERDRVRQSLFDREIYPPVHWPIQDIVPAEFQSSHRLAQEIMTLPCDQRYSLEDMKRLGQVFKSLKPLPVVPA